MIVAIVMLKGIFSKVTAWAGIVACVEGIVGGFYVIYPPLAVLLVPCMIAYGLWGVLAGARLFAERLCLRVAQTATPTAHGPVHVTVSLGVAAIQAEGDGWTAVLGRADQALYQAKRAGKNRVVVASSISES